MLKTKRDRVVASLKGNWKPEHIFALKQALCAYTFYQNQIGECDEQFEALLNAHTDDKPAPSKISPPKN